MLSLLNGRKIQGVGAKGNATALSEAQMIAQLSEAVASDPRPVKVLAQDADATPRTIQNARDGLHLPHGKTLINLARVCPAVKAVVLQWMDADQNYDPDADMLLLQAFRMATDYIERRQKRLDDTP